MDIQQEVDSVRSKSLHGGLKDGVAMIPFTGSLWDDTCFSHFRFIYE